MTLVRFTAVLIIALLLAACSNANLVRVCDPCGCKCVAEPLIKKDGEIPRGDEAEIEAAKAAEAEKAAKAKRATEAAKKRGGEVYVNHVLATEVIKGLSWDEVSLDEAVAYLRTVSGLEFYISPKVREEKFDDVVISLNVDSVTVEAVLDLITRPFEMSWEVRAPVVWILTREELSGKIRLRYYDVKDLVIQKEAKPEKPGMPVRAPTKPTEAETKLIEDIRKKVHARYWAENDAAIEGRNGILIVRAPKVVHEGIEELLTAKRRAGKPYRMSAHMRKKLDAKKVYFGVDKETLGGVIGILQAITGMNIMIDPRYVADVEKTMVVGLKAKNLSLSTVLNMLAAAAGEDAVWQDKQNVLILTRKEYVKEGQ